MDPLISYHRNGDLLKNIKDAHKLRLKTARFWLSPKEKLYWRSFLGPNLHCIHPDKVHDFFFEIHKGSCSAHKVASSPSAFLRILVVIHVERHATIHKTVWKVPKIFTQYRDSLCKACYRLQAHGLLRNGDWISSGQCPNPSTINDTYL